jgi:hypothetical protein
MAHGGNFLVTWQQPVYYINYKYVDNIGVLMHVTKYVCESVLEAQQHFRLFFPQYDTSIIHVDANVQTFLSAQKKHVNCLWHDVTAHSSYLLLKMWLRMVPGLCDAL